MHKLDLLPNGRARLPKEYFIPLMRQVLDLINEFKQLVSEGKDNEAFAVEERISSLYSTLSSEHNRKTIVKIMHDTTGTRKRWIYREKKIEVDDE